MPVQQTNGRVILTHPKGASAEILLYGATVISWKSGSKANSTPVERLFVSSKAALDGSKPVRGGIPVVFPNFGAPTHPEHAKLSQHGFARSAVWNFDSVVMDNEAGVSVRLTLTPTPDIMVKYLRPFHLAYVVTLAEHQLSTDLHVKNTSQTTSTPPDALEFQALLHTYIRAPANDVLIFPLQGKKYYDKTEPTEQARNQPKEETRAGVDVKAFTDSVYEDVAGKYEVTWPGGSIEVKAKNFKDVVVWNPSAEAGSKLADMEDGGWERFVCVEPGYVRGFARVNPGETWVGQQVLTVLHEERAQGQL
ncbi:galactose mutarotase-like protein [Gloeophyllum trabeum ATCC 11539]|uniref:Glucose-6-phosphate 1-epimerase n=1 Tax=Gloeophyllum trabeum (strain ATCC 11539 / FP-39264 / Madison 617) TaxID=670483 RepID=S7QMU9_GLOTA|nr:galactose mutarotase-like protein [Gloeophyllum trabeum ATCC 11539]EPQ60813.1 galactose mutarotase-like protein [Gloeophyllum trabeum ATCC 11539]